MSFFLLLSIFSADRADASGRLAAIETPALATIRGLAPEVRAGLLARRVGDPKTADGRMGVVVSFTAEPTAGDLQACRASGFEFDRLPSGSMAHVGSIYSGRIAPEKLADLADLPAVERLDTTWRPAVQRPLDLSVPETQVDQVWAQVDALQQPICGEGVTIADLDTGIDIFHPGFFRDDGGTYSWIDVNANSQFDPGTDAVDLDGNSQAGTGETLRFLDGAVYDDPTQAGPLFLDGFYDTDRDWLYNDANGDGWRNYGRSYGFTDTSPCFGERFFIAGDTNANGRLDPGEMLIGLGSSKVKAVYNPYTNQEWNRGTNLIDCESDANGHGTGVCGVLAQDSAGRGRKLVGLAPDVELVVANIFSGIDIADEVQFTKVMNWASDQGAKIFLWEIGAITYHFTDGSSAWEQAVNSSAAQGIVQVCPAGNYSGGGKHASADLGPGANLNLPFHVPTAQEGPYYATTRYIFFSILWPGTSSEIDVQVQSPTGSPVMIPTSPPNGTLSMGTDGSIYYARDVSPRGTAGVFLTLYKGLQGGEPLATGNWTLAVTNQTASSRPLGLWSLDDISSWGYGVVWQSHLDDDTTIDLPATADSALAVASYSTRGYYADVGGLSGFSNRGPRIDGVNVMDIAAPGNYDIYAARSKDAYNATPATYTSFGGTSAAGPHVAAVAALLAQAAPSAGQSEISAAIHSGAAADGYTGAVPNESWGYGKLRAAAALSLLDPGGGEGIPGDANVDGTVNILDIVVIVNHILGINTLTGQGLENAEMTGDQVISILDLVAVVNVILDKQPLASSPGLEKPDGEIQVTATHDGEDPALLIDPGNARPIALDLTLSASSDGLGAGPFELELPRGGEWKGRGNRLRDRCIRIVLYRVTDDPLDEPVAVTVKLAGRDDPVSLSWIEGVAVDPAGERIELQPIGFPLRVEAIPATDPSVSSPMEGSFRVVPNPSAGPVSIFLAPRVEHGGNQPRIFSVHDITGASVCRLRVPEGMFRIEWDGRDASGRPAASGLYFVREVGGEGRGLRLLLIR
ncbi:MAG: S8 family serine peptidase [Candidatus Eisenbacteria bacterium]|uniref:S8 family serine peptidase n=1 Tax=Eiseniibacteriota bacterium TaxID=2212470 RepID=A0A948W8Y2_UNCEI|nr:S8 family serine peptidase [Candidatus Eisenbacteria bacterium]MBU2693176.1 S8 family serine peptidase [Candidatus Eisenbacteria bacterium]